MPGWTPPTISSSTRASVLPRGWRAWLWLSWWTSLALLAAGAAIIVELASKRDASAARLAGQSGSLTYAAGWPLAFAHVRLVGLTDTAWNAAIHSMTPPNINWPLLVADSILLALLFNMGIALSVASWRMALRLRRNETTREMLQAALTGTAVAAFWGGISAGVITTMNQAQPTDAATRAQLFQPFHLTLLAPGVIGYEVQRWFENDAGPNISLTGGIANGVEGIAIVAFAFVVPAALLTMVAVVGWRVARARHQT